MTTYTSWVTPGYPVIAAPQIVEVQSNSVEHASLLIRRKYPGHSFTLPRAEDTTRYHRDFLDSEAAVLYDKAPA